MKKVISTQNAPAAIGPYSQAIEVKGMVYTSGVIPVNPATGEIPDGAEAQTRQAMTSLSNLLEKKLKPEKEEEPKEEEKPEKETDAPKDMKHQQSETFRCIRMIYETTG